VNNHDHRKKKKKEHKCKENGKACRYVRNTRKGLRRLSGQTQKGYSEELPDDNADFTDRGGAFVAVRPKDNARALQVWVIKYAQKRVEQASTDENFARTNIKDEYIQTVR